MLTGSFFVVVLTLKVTLHSLKLFSAYGAEVRLRPETRMPNDSIPASFMRGGSSKGLFFHAGDLPINTTERDRIFLAVMGSPDGYGRQLDGLGGGVSSVSKVVVVSASDDGDTDINYMFGQVAIDRPIVDYSSTCGNLASAVGPFAINSGLVTADSGETCVRVRDVNTGKVLHAYVPTAEDGMFREAGEFSIPGVSGSGSKIRLKFLDPGGATTGKLLPTGNTIDVIEVPGEGAVEMSLVDATTSVAFAEANRFGLRGTETVAEIEGDGKLMARLDQARRVAAMHMGLAERPEDSPLGNPKFCLVAPSQPFSTLAGETIPASAADISVRFLSMGQMHRVLPLTGAMCLAAACRIEGTISHANSGSNGGDVRLANPSGVLSLGAKALKKDDNWMVPSVTVYRTARVLMEGKVPVPRRPN